MGMDRLPEEVLSVLSKLRDGDSAAADSTLNEFLLSCSVLDFHSRAIVGSAKVCWVVDIQDHLFLMIPGFLSILDSQLRLVNAVQTSLNDWLESGRPTLLYSIWQSCWDGMWGNFPEDPSESSIPSYAAVVSALVLLSLVYQYLTGNVDKGGPKAYSRSSLDFRDVYVAIVLFLGAYVWIKFREVARRGVHRRTLVGKQGSTKVVYDARLKPPMWNGRKVPRLELGRFATPQEAHNKFLIAAFYYNQRSSEECLLDGWFPVPSMSDRERSLTGLELRAWVLDQAKKVYEDFKKKKVDATWFQDLFEAWEHQATQERVEVNVDPCAASLLNSAEPQKLVRVCQVENSGMSMGMIGDNHGLECASHSFDGRHEGLALSNSLCLGFGGGSALPVSQLPPNTECLNGSDQLDILQTCMSTQPQQISLQQNQMSDPQQQIFLLQQQIQGLVAQILQLQRQQRIQQQQELQDSWIQNPQWPCQFCLQQQQLQDVNQGFPSFEVETEQSMHQRNYLGLMAPPPNGGAIQEASSELDTLMYCTCSVI